MADPDPYACMRSIEAFEQAPAEEVANAVLILCFGHRLAERWPTVGHGDLDDAVLNAIPGVRGSGMITVSPHVSTARWVLAEALMALEQAGLAMRSYYDTGNQYILVLTRRGHQALTSGDPAAWLPSR